MSSLQLPEGDLYTDIYLVAPGGNMRPNKKSLDKKTIICI